MSGKVRVLETLTELGTVFIQAAYPAVRLDFINKWSLK